MTEFSNFSIQDRPAVGLQIYQFLKQSIISCEIEPGRAISEKEMAAAMNVSRQPVREAFIQLAKCGLVHVYPQRGTYVKQISIKTVLDGQLIRSSIECAIVERLARTITPTQIQELYYLIELQRHAIDGCNYRLFLEHDDAFHRQLSVADDCLLAWQTIETVKPVMDRIRYLDLQRDSSMLQVLEEHRNIVAALEQHDGQQALTLLHQHLNGFPYVIDAIRTRYADWFAD
ncbi:GntR family transcriptional regulator [Celerinatantimonas yamalensis]|uniref:GntR family transcriptional regulator n=1 Tax=Celerinatantimonas yamalensis TaxID=559956 RepID=A0ABW9G785_9GAMM